VNPWIGRLELSIYVHRTEIPADDRAHALARAAAVVALCDAAGLDAGRVHVRELGARPPDVDERVRVAVVTGGGTPTGPQYAAQGPEAPAPATAPAKPRGKPHSGSR
jgi:hypothetical protein